MKDDGKGLFGKLDRITEETAKRLSDVIEKGLKGNSCTRENYLDKSSMSGLLEDKNKLEKDIASLLYAFLTAFNYEYGDKVAVDTVNLTTNCKDLDNTMHRDILRMTVNIDIKIK